MSTPAFAWWVYISPIKSSMAAWCSRHPLCKTSLTKGSLLCDLQLVKKIFEIADFFAQSSPRREGFFAL